MPRGWRRRGSQPPGSTSPTRARLRRRQRRERRKTSWPQKRCSTACGGVRRRTCAKSSDCCEGWSRGAIGLRPWPRRWGSNGKATMRPTICRALLLVALCACASGSSGVDITKPVTGAEASNAAKAYEKGMQEKKDHNPLEATRYFAEFYWKRQQWRGAAGRYMTLADTYGDLQGGKVQADSLWRAAQAYRNANDPGDERKALQRLVQEAPRDPRRAEAEALLRQIPANAPVTSPTDAKPPPTAPPEGAKPAAPSNRPATEPAPASNPPLTPPLAPSGG